MAYKIIYKWKKQANFSLKNLTISKYLFWNKVKIVFIPGKCGGGSQYTDLPQFWSPDSGERFKLNSEMNPKFNSTLSDMTVPNLFEALQWYFPWSIF